MTNVDELRLTATITEELRTQLEALRAILVAEQGHAWLPGIDAALWRLADPALLQVPQYLTEVRSLIETMFQPGGLGDFFVWRDDLEDRRVANKELKAIHHELWNIVTTIPASGSDKGTHET